jgi:hypothetical protein
MSTISAGQMMTTSEQEALNQIFRKVQGPVTSSFYLALLTNAASGSVDNTWTTMAQVTEFSAAGGYARQVFGPGAPTAASPSVISNAGTLTFGPLTTPSGTVIWGMGTDATGAGSGTTAKLMAAFLLSSSRTPANGDSLQAAAAAFTCQV